MAQTAQFEIIVSGWNGSAERSGATMGVCGLASLVGTAEALLSLQTKRRRPSVVHHTENGCVRHVFTTDKESVDEVHALLVLLRRLGDVDGLSAAAAQAFGRLQTLARDNDCHLCLRTSVNDEDTVHITPSSRYDRTARVWVDAEWYYHGQLTDSGEDDGTCIHLRTSEHGTIRIHVPMDFPEKFDGRPRFPSLLVRVTGRQNASTGEIDMTTLNLLELSEHRPAYDAAYIGSLRENAMKAWLSGIDPDAWMEEVRGGVYDF